MNFLEDANILEYFFERDEAAIVETRQKYGGRLYKTALNILHSKEDAEECVSDALFKTWRAIPPAKPEHLGAYVAKITRNAALHKYEHSHAAKRGGGEVSVLLSELEASVGNPPEGARNLRPEEKFEAKQVTIAINNWLATTDKVVKAVFVLRYFHGESIADIQNRYKISESKVKSILFRARKKLNLHLQKEGVLV